MASAGRGRCGAGGSADARRGPWGRGGRRGGGSGVAGSPVAAASAAAVAWPGEKKGAAGWEGGVGGGSKTCALLHSPLHTHTLSDPKIKNYWGGGSKSAPGRCNPEPGSRGRRETR